MRNCSLMSLTSLKLMPEEFNQALGCKMQSDSKKNQKKQTRKKKLHYFNAGKRQDKATKLKAARITKQ